MEKITIENFQKDFDNLMNRVENGESFLVKDETGKSVVVMPCDEEVIIRIHTEHNDAS